MNEIAASLLLAAPQLLSELFLALDARDYAALTACFAPDGVWTRRGRDLVGAAAIADTLQETRSPSLVTVHAVSTVAAALHAPDRGAARFYLTVFRHDDGTVPAGPVPVPIPAVVGLCTAEFVRISDCWRIQRLKTGPYAFGAQ